MFWGCTLFKPKILRQQYSNSFQDCLTSQFFTTLKSIQKKHITAYESSAVFLNFVHWRSSSDEIIFAALGHTFWTYANLSNG